MDVVSRHNLMYIQALNSVISGFTHIGSNVAAFDEEDGKRFFASERELIDWKDKFDKFYKLHIIIKEQPSTPLPTHLSVSNKSEALDALEHFNELFGYYRSFDEMMIKIKTRIGAPEFAEKLRNASKINVELFQAKEKLLTDIEACLHRADIELFGTALGLCIPYLDGNDVAKYLKSHPWNRVSIILYRLMEAKMSEVQRLEIRPIIEKAKNDALGATRTPFVDEFGFSHPITCIGSFAEIAKALDLPKVATIEKLAHKLEAQKRGLIVITRHWTDIFSYFHRGLVDKEYIVAQGLQVEPAQCVSEEAIKKFDTLTYLGKGKGSGESAVKVYGKDFETHVVLGHLAPDIYVLYGDGKPDVSMRPFKYNRMQEDIICATIDDPRVASAAKLFIDAPDTRPIGDLLRSTFIEVANELVGTFDGEIIGFPKALKAKLIELVGTKWYRAGDEEQNLTQVWQYMRLIRTFSFKIKSKIIEKPSASKDDLRGIIAQQDELMEADGLWSLSDSGQLKLYTAQLLV